ncbi:hypothetical protein J6590_079947 [Homalodisca vitripennis]|nr:hypothetical protein J6590_079947 [Homalodisca vitripennis]
MAGVYRQLADINMMVPTAAAFELLLQPQLHRRLFEYLEQYWLSTLGNTLKARDKVTEISIENDYRYL